MNEISIIRCGKRPTDGKSEYRLTVNGREAGTPLTLSEVICVLRMVESEEGKRETG